MIKLENALDSGYRLSAYLSLGVSAGLLGSHTASAQIVHTTTEVPVSIGTGSTVWWNPATGQTEVTGGAVPTTFGAPFAGMDFAGSHYIYSQDSSFDFLTTASGGSNMAFLGAGDTISSSGNWKRGFTYIDRPGWTTADTGWAAGVDGTVGYIGFRYDPSASGDYVYGWAKFTYNAASSGLVLQDFAYRNALGMPITAGDIGAVPEPANAGLLFAMGAAGIAVARRLQKMRSAQAV